jgi:excisionase family DNA binding protein
VTGEAPRVPEPLLTPAEVAARFRVDPKTVTRWAKAGKLTSIRTLGGHRRYRLSDIEAALRGEYPRPAEVAGLAVLSAALDGDGQAARSAVKGLPDLDLSALRSAAVVLGRVTASEARRRGRQ